MSDYMSLTAPDYLDDRTKIIIQGYLRNSQQSLSTSTLFNAIPSEIYIILLSYIDDHFMMYRGSHEWKITNPKLIQGILTSATKQKFTSTVFEVGKLQWVMNLFPNGSDIEYDIPDGQCVAVIQTLSFPSSWYNIIICATIICKEINTKHTFTREVANDDDNVGVGCFCMLNDFINANPMQLTFIISIKILRITVDYSDVKYQSYINKYRKHYKIKWNVDTTSRTIKCSNIIGDMFCAYYQPSTSRVQLILCGLPNKQQIGYNKSYPHAVQVQWTLIIQHLDIECHAVSRLKFGDREYTEDSLLVPLSNDMKKNMENELLFEIELEILTEYDSDKNVIGNDIAGEWDKYLLNENKVDVTSKDNVLLNEQKKDTKINDDGELKTVLTKILKTQQSILEEIECIKKDVVMIKSMHIKGVDDDDSLEIFKLWLKNEVKLEQYFGILVDNGFDNKDAIKTTNIDQLKQIGIIKVGHRQQLIQHIQQLNNSQSIDMKK